ncbi:alpha/beta fold hydrolase [Dubosiella newyorkensis]|uniref:AB hydrolase-1 domain-containing protein n=8 Tax=Dubosiella newyorkensis TaxID=1862672 RepID=A0A1U7NNW0_9FIRM|nr:alpha/beta hydrolase [Dubosiella newyorkensis]OLU47034.1 hypothetical protein BO225_03815 [Dubosiella newyorkensis]
MYLNQEKRMMINGALQYILLLAEHKDLPLLIYVHGGPGDAALPLLLHYQKELASKYTLVLWEQRGAGKSYYEFGQYENLLLDDYVQDLHEIVQYVLKRFHQEKVYLCAHDFGTIIGFLFLQQYPQLVHTYIGISQVVNMKKAMRLRLRYAIENSKPIVANKLLKIDAAFGGANWYSDLDYLDKQIFKLKGTLYKKKNDSLLRSFYLKSNKFTLFDYQRYLKGITQSKKKLWPQIMAVDFESIVKWKVPIVLIEGKNDKLLSSALAKAYFDKLESEKTWYWFEESSHFPHWCESKRFNSILLELVSKKAS